MEQGLRSVSEVRTLNRKLWAGLDVGVETTRLCVLNDSGEVLQEASCPTCLESVHGELKWLRRRRFARVGIEAGTGTTLARGLRSLGYPVDMYETRQLSKFLRARRNKTDAGDANGIADAGRIGASMVSKVHLKSLDCQALLTRLIVRKHLIRERVGAANLLCRQLELYGGRISKCPRSKRLRIHVDAEIRRLFGKATAGAARDLRHLLDHCERLITYQYTFDRELKRFAAENEVCSLLMSIPGVGPLCALSFYATIAEPNRFTRSADVGGYLGLTPKLHQSGLSKRMGRISRMGNRAMRTLLVNASVQFMKHSAPEDELRKWAIRVQQRSGRGQARVALARKLAVVMLAMWKRGAPYSAPAACETEGFESTTKGESDPAKPQAQISAHSVLWPTPLTQTPNDSPRARRPDALALDPHSL